MSPTQLARNRPLLIQCAELVFPWLTPAELAAVALTCKSLYQISKSVTLHRSSDASGGLEDLPIPFQNPVDDQPYAFFFYTPRQIPSSHFAERQSWGSSSSAGHGWAGRPGVESVRWVDDLGDTATGCGCENCGEDANGGQRCPCLVMFDGLEDVVSECGSSCGCGWECPNRLTQRGVSVSLQIVKHVRKGWGLYAAQLIPKGQFVCEYAGMFLNPLFKVWIFFSPLWKYGYRALRSTI